MMLALGTPLSLYPSECQASSGVGCKKSEIHWGAKYFLKIEWGDQFFFDFHWGEGNFQAIFHDVEKLAVLSLVLFIMQ